MICARFVCFAALLRFHSFACGQWRGPNSVSTLSPLEQKLRESRFELHLETGKFTGNAAPVLERDCRGKYVLIGEDHLTREIPEFTSVVCGVMARKGLSAMLADSERTVSLHICVLGVRGVHGFYGGYKRPTKLEHFVTDEDSTYRWLKPAIDNSLSSAWTLFDLRRMRFQNLGSVDPGMERLLYGYDLLVLAPELTPADPIE